MNGLFEATFKSPAKLSPSHIIKRQELIMNEIISWMIEVETKAANLYANAAVTFSGDDQFACFLTKLVNEEKDHIKLLEESMASLSYESISNVTFHFDEDFRHKILAPIINAQCSLSRDELSQREMVAVIAEIEFSEWNEVFIYAIDAAQVLDEEFQNVAYEIDQHRKHIQEYISSLPESENLLQKVKRLKSASNKRVLIVEDNVAVARMLEVLTIDEAEVLLARNSEEGLSHILEGRFDLIVADVIMPKMNGIEMYKKALSIDPTLEGRFIFFTGTEDPEERKFLQSSNVIVLPKPSPVKVICQVIAQVLEKASSPEKIAFH
jgi:CheY-like chemotaxis protein/rubrerythrin